MVDSPVISDRVRSFDPSSPPNQLIANTDTMSFFGDAKNAFDSFTSHIKKEIDNIQGDEEPSVQSQGNTENSSNVVQGQNGGNRFESFAPPRTSNEAKWYVDGCGYMWAVSVAIEEARESIWILDWWLSPGMSTQAGKSQYLVS